MIKGAVVVGIMLLTATGCGSGSKADGGSESSKRPATFTARGTLVLDSTENRADNGTANEGDPCSATLDYSDLQGGGQVVVRDAGDKQVGLGTLGQGKFNSAILCAVPFEVSGIPDTGDIFSVEVGHRGKVSFKRADAENLTISLGG